MPAADESSQTSSEQSKPREEQARNQDLSNQIEALEEEIIGCTLQKALDDYSISELEEELKVKASGLSECKRELERSRESEAWSDYNLALAARRLQASNDQVQNVLSGHQRSLGFFS